MLHAVVYNAPIMRVSRMPAHYVHNLLSPKSPHPVELVTCQWRIQESDDVYAHFRDNEYHWVPGTKCVLVVV